MVTILKQGSDKKTIKKLLSEMVKQRNPKKGVDTFKYCGTITLDKDPMSIQKELRDEWE